MPFNKGENLLWGDYEVKFLDQAVRTMESYVSQFPDVRVRWEEASKWKWNKKKMDKRQRLQKNQQRQTRGSTMCTCMINSVCLIQSVGENCQKGKKTGGLRLFTSPPGGAADCKEEGWYQDKEGWERWYNLCSWSAFVQRHTFFLLFYTVGRRRDECCQNCLWRHQ